MLCQHIRHRADTLLQNSLDEWILYISVKAVVRSLDHVHFHRDTRFTQSFPVGCPLLPEQIDFLGLNVGWGKAHEVCTPQRDGVPLRPPEAVF